MAKNSSVPIKGLPIPRFTLSLGFSDLQWVAGEISGSRENEIDRFEEKFATHLGVHKAIFTTKARAALMLILQSLNLPKHSKVIIPAWTHYSVPATIIAAGLQPYLVDVRKSTWVMGPETITEEDWRDASAIIITHMYGCPAPVEDLIKTAKRKRVVVIEDCTQSFGASVNGKKVGSFGDAAIFSFDLTSNFTTLGGGMAVFQNQELADLAAKNMEGAVISPSTEIYPTLVKAAAICVATNTFGFLLGIYPFLSLGWSFLKKDTLHGFLQESIQLDIPDLGLKPSPVQAALGRRLLEWAESQNEIRAHNGKTLIDLFKKASIPDLLLPECPDYGESVFTSFAVCHDQNEAICRQLSSRSIDTSPGYISPVQQISLLQDRVQYIGTLPNSTYISKNQIHLPVYPRLKDKDLARIVTAFEQATETVLNGGVPPQHSVTSTPQKIEDLIDNNASQQSQLTSTEVDMDGGQFPPLRAPSPMLKSNSGAPEHAPENLNHSRSSVASTTATPSYHQPSQAGGNALNLTKSPILPISSPAGDYSSPSGAAESFGHKAGADVSTAFSAPAPNTAHSTFSPVSTGTASSEPLQQRNAVPFPPSAPPVVSNSPHSVVPPVQQPIGARLAFPRPGSSSEHTGFNQPSVPAANGRINAPQQRQILPGARPGGFGPISGGIPVRPTFPQQPIRQPVAGQAPGPTSTPHLEIGKRSPGTGVTPPPDLQGPPKD